MPQQSKHEKKAFMFIIKRFNEPENLSIFKNSDNDLLARSNKLQQQIVSMRRKRKKNIFNYLIMVMI